MVIAAVNDVTQLPIRMNYARNQFQFDSEGSNMINLSEVLLASNSNNNMDCSNTEKLYFIVMVTLTIDDRYNFFAATLPSEEDGMEIDVDKAYNASLTCNDATGHFPFSHIGCTIMGSRYYYLTHERASCLGPRAPKATNSNNSNTVCKRRRALLYWYNRALDGGKGDIKASSVDKTTTDVETMLKDTEPLCNQSLYQILHHSNASLYCGSNNMAHQYVAMNAWLELALQWITMRLNFISCGIMIDETIIMDYLLAMDTLERGCATRATSLANVHMNQTVMNELYQRIARYNQDSLIGGDMIAHHMQCLVLAETLGFEGLKEMEHGFLPIYLDRYKDWYFPFASFFILYDVADMRMLTIIFSVFFVFCAGVFTTFLLIWPITICVDKYRRWRYTTKYDYVL
jgi:hypothetical protein